MDIVILLINHDKNTLNYFIFKALEYARKLSKDSHLSEEIAQEALKRFFEKLGIPGIEIGDPMAYISGIIKNVHSEYRRKSSNLVELDDDVLQALGSAFEEGEGMKEKIEEALIKFRQNDFRLAYIIERRQQDWSYEDIAEEMSLTPETVRNLHVKAKKMLKIIIDNLDKI